MRADRHLWVVWIRDEVMLGIRSSCETEICLSLSQPEDYEEATNNVWLYLKNKQVGEAVSSHLV